VDIGIIAWPYLVFKSQKYCIDQSLQFVNLKNTEFIRQNFFEGAFFFFCLEKSVLIGHRGENSWVFCVLSCMLSLGQKCCQIDSPSPDPSIFCSNGALEYSNFLDEST
jgi:hypothetical protein